LRKRTIRASEIGTYLYCKRAWWYQSQGIESQNQQELAGGFNYHQRHGKHILTGVLLRVLGWLVLTLALILLAVWFTQQLIG
jgi:hypothetical protein